jgi:DNA polymerase-3 subunit delta'
MAERLVQMVMCGEPSPPCRACSACRRVAGRSHGDASWIEPESKSRVITVDDVRGLITRMAQTSFEGGWRAGVIVYADRLNAPASNALLKTLEEPGRRSLLVLVTDEPHALLPTLLSRCQRLTLAGRDGVPDGAWRPALLELLRRGLVQGPLDRAAAGAVLKALMDAERERALAELEKSEPDLDDKVVAARVQAAALEARENLLTAMVLWARDVLVLAAGVDGPLHFADEREPLAAQAAALGREGAARRLRAVEDLARRLGRNVPELVAFEAAFSPLAG